MNRSNDDFIKLRHIALYALFALMLILYLSSLFYGGRFATGGIM